VGQCLHAIDPLAIATGSVNVGFHHGPIAAQFFALYHFHRRGVAFCHELFRPAPGQIRAEQAEHLVILQLSIGLGAPFAPKTIIKNN
jgi:hypothetical protein